MHGVDGFMYPNEMELQWSILIVLYPYITGLVAGAFILASLERVFNVAAVKPTYRLALLTALAFLIVLAPLAFLTALRYLPALEPLWPMLNVFRYAVTAGVLIIALFIAHKWLPAGNRRLLDILPGIGVTLMLWLIAGKLFGDYLAQFAKNYVSTYAGLASVMVALVFLYMIASIFIYGGELNATIMELRKERRRRKSGPV